MRRSTLTVLALAALTGLAAAACGSKDTGPSFSGTISNADAADAGSTADDFTGDLVSTFDFGTGPGIGLSARFSPAAVALLNQSWNLVGGRGAHFASRGGPIQLAAPLLASASGCASAGEPVISGDTADADDDGIPNNATVTVDCDSTLANGITISEHERVHLQDVSGLYGYSFSVSISIVESHADTVYTVSANGSDNAAFSATSANDNLNLTVSEVDKVADVSTGGAEHQEWNATFTPTSDDLVLGDPLPDGHISFTGNFYVTNAADATQNFRFDILTTVPLAFNATCFGGGDNPPFTDGQIQGKFNGNGSVGFTVTYDNGCDSAPTIVGTGNESV